MRITFTLTDEYAQWLTALHGLTQQAPYGPRFARPDDLCRSLIEAIADDDARDNGDILNRASVSGLGEPAVALDR